MFMKRTPGLLNFLETMRDSDFAGLNLTSQLSINNLKTIDEDHPELQLYVIYTTDQYARLCQKPYLYQRKQHELQAHHPRLY